MGREARCNYRFDSGAFCEDPVEGSGELCFFHDPKIKKNTPEARAQVLKAVEAKKYLEGAHLEGADLSRADLKGAWFVKAHLNGANLTRADLEKAHVFGADLRRADLFNANLDHANLKESNLELANLLEIKISGAKMLGVNWGRGKRVTNELEGLRLERSGKRKEAQKKFLEAEEIYRNFRIHLGMTGIFGAAGDFFYREMVMRRKQMPALSFQRLGSKVTDILCGYGEKTFRILSSALSLIALNSFAYFLLGIQYRESFLGYDPLQTAAQNIHEYFMALYFSVVTFTTLGYGDIAPLGFSRIFAASEAFSGAFMIALFVLVFSRKMLR